jgi:hypothetical protein
LFEQDKNISLDCGQLGISQWTIHGDDCSLGNASSSNASLPRHPRELQKNWRKCDQFLSFPGSQSVNLVGISTLARFNGRRRSPHQWASQAWVQWIVWDCSGDSICW